MKSTEHIITLTSLLAVCALLSGCGTTGGGAVTGAKPVPGLNLEVLKEANRHAELCHRTVSWPFTFFIDCPAQTPPAVSLEAIQAMIDKAVARAREPGS